MDSATLRADYADARHVHSRAESISTRNGVVDEVERGESEGVGVRVRVGGAWGFAATRATSRAALDEALARALAIAEAQPAAPVGALAPEPPARGHWESACDVDPFQVSLEDKLAALLEADALMQGDQPLAVTSATFLAFSDSRTFAST